MSACPTQELLEHLLADQLSEQQRESLEEHLASCPTCQQRLGDLTRDPLTEQWRQSQQVSDSSSLDPEHGLFLLTERGQWRDELPPPAADATASPPATPQPSLSSPQSTVEYPRPPDNAHKDAPPCLPDVPGYEVIAELGRGGMSIVYKARQIGLDRLVALKMMQQEKRADDSKGSRILRAEAHAIARMRHPHIVQIYDVGEHDGQLYLSLEYLDGGSLARQLDGKPQPPREAAALAVTLARTVQYAHDCGIIHRDLKPTNILLQNRGAGDKARSVSEGEVLPSLTLRAPTTCKIADFGLAKRLDDAATLFASGTILGTPAYMAPEQVSGPKSALGPAVDIYALGIILYEMMTGRPPFRGESSYDTFLQVVHQEAVSPRQLQPKIPIDLETICLKCLRKEPHKRYASAGDLADDLERFLAGQPIRARPVGWLERTAKWLGRHPAAAGLLVLVLLVVVSAFPLLLWQLQNAEARIRAETAAKDEANQREEQERQARRQAERLSARDLFHQGNTLCEQGQTAAGLLSFASALELAVHAEDSDLERLLRSNLSAWRHRLVQKRAELRHFSPIWAVAYSPQGDRAATASGSTLADAENTVRLWDVAAGRQLGKPLRHDKSVFCLAFSPDGTKLVTGTRGPSRNAIYLWDIKSGKCVRRWDNVEGVVQVAFVGRGDRIVSLSPPTARLWDPQVDQPVAELRRNIPVLALAWGRDGRTLATGDADGQVHLWDAADGQPLGNSLFDPDALPGPVWRLAFHPDGKTLAVAVGILPVRDKNPVASPWGEVHFWDVGRAKPTGVVLHHRGTIQALAFSPDGSLLATGNAIHDWRWPPHAGELAVWGEAQLWDAKTGEPWGRSMLHPSGVMSLAFSPDSQLLLTGGEDGKVRLFTVQGGEPIDVPHNHEGSVKSLAFSPDGRTVLTGSAGGDNLSGATAGLWELPAEIGPIRRLPGSRGGRIAAFSPKGDRFLTGDYSSRSALAWTIPAAQAIEAMPEHPAKLNGLSFTANGQTLLTCGQDQKVRFWDPAGGRTQREFLHDRSPGVAVLSPDGRTLLTLTDISVLRIWDVESGQCRHTRPPEGKVLALAFLPDGRAVWLERDTKHQRAWLWSWTPDEGTKQLWHRPLACGRACFAPDAETVLVFEGSQGPQLIETRTGQPCGPALPRHREGIEVMRVHRSGRMILIGGSDRTARLWDAATGQPLGPPLRHHQRVIAGAFAPTAPLLATSDSGGSYLWSIPAPIAGTPERVRLWIEVLTGMELDAAGTLRDLEPAVHEQRRAALRAMNGSP